jgi:hypothetical protein
MDARGSSSSHPKVPATDLPRSGSSLLEGLGWLNYAICGELANAAVHVLANPALFIWRNCRFC